VNEATSPVGGNGGTYGGGGGGTGYARGSYGTNSYGTGGNGVIIITYTPSTKMLFGHPGVIY
jgi:hypothetical protein